LIGFIQLAVVVMPPFLSKEQFSIADLKVLRTLYYWTLQNEVEKKWKCNQCPIIRVKGNGWTNLIRQAC
jgi:hypothetical protein